MVERKIQAIIVSNEQPPRVLIDRNGRLPETDYKPAHGTFEGTLHALGRKAFGNGIHVSVDCAFPSDGKTVYQAKPVDAVEPISGHSWKNVSGTFEYDPEAEAFLLAELARQDEEAPHTDQSA